MDVEALKIENLEKNFTVDNETVKVFENVNFEIKDGEFVCIVGPSGCGKSTLLRIIGGLEEKSDGKITYQDTELKGINRDIGMIFQQSRLFPWLRIGKNIEFGISREEKKGLSKGEINSRVDKYLELVDLSGFKKAFPKQLSGGMQQRVSIARSLIENPKVLLLDEPFSALDAFTRVNLQNELIRIWEKEKRTMIMVTHDIDEAIYLSDKIIILSERPSTIKKIINVKDYIGRPRDRSSEDFIRLRREIMLEFFEKHEDMVEYYI